MNYKFTKTLFALLALISFASQSNAQYCTAGPNSTADTEIRNITLIGNTTSIQNPTTCPGAVGVRNFLNLAADLSIGETYTLTGSWGTCGGEFGRIAKGWIDWNQNQVFDANEVIFTSPFYGSTIISSFNFTVPMNAALGTTRMRIILNETEVSTYGPCTSFTWGSAHDYTINVLAIDSLDILPVEIFNVSTPGNALVDTIKCRILNNGSEVLNSFTLNWKLNGISQSTPTFSGFSLSPFATSPALTLGTADLSSGTSVIKVITSLPNGQADENTTNDTLSKIICNGLTGTFTVGSPGSDFTTIEEARDLLYSCNVIGPVVWELNPNVIFNLSLELDGDSINGLSATNNLTINGNHAQWEFSGTSAIRYAVRLLNLKHTEINNVKFKALSSQFRNILVFSGDADSNKITNCVFDHGNLSGGINPTGVVFTSNLTDVFTASSLNNFSGNTINRCIFLGGRIGILENGQGGMSSNNTFSENTFENFAWNGVHLFYANESQVLKNTFSRENPVSIETNSSAIYVQETANSLIEGNKVSKMMLSTQNLAVYGFRIFNSIIGSGNTITIANNQFTNFRSNGQRYYIDVFSQGSLHKIFHNTILDTTFNSSVIGIRWNNANTEVLNNNITFHPSGLGPNRGFSSTSTGVFDFNNVYFSNTSGTNIYATYSNTNRISLANLQAAGLGFNSKNLDPQYAFPESEKLIPTNPNLNNSGLNVNISSDILGNSRPSINPDIGAYEFSTANTNLEMGPLELPASDCQYSSNYNLGYKFKNIGIDTVYTCTVGLFINGSLNQTEIINFQLAPNEFYSGTFSQDIDLSEDGVYNLTAYLNNSLDTLNQNDSSSISIENLSAIQITSTNPLIENVDDNPFDGSLVNFVNGWKSDYNTSIHWTTRSFNTPLNNTGPNGDNTTGSGRYFYTQGNNSISSTSTLESPCFTMKDSNLALTLEFFYHRFGANMGDLELVINDEFQDYSIFNFTGQSQSASSDTFKRAFFDINRFSGRDVSLKFIANSGNGQLNHMAIDDIKLSAEPFTCDTGAISFTLSRLNSSAQLFAQTSIGYKEIIVEYGLTGFTQGQGTTIISNSNSPIISNLNTNEAYAFYVRQRCADSSLGAWSGPVRFIQDNLCTDNLHTTGCQSGVGLGSFTLNNFTYTAQSCGPNSYLKLDTAIAVQQTLFYNLNLASRNSLNRSFAVWADWDKDGEFNSSNEFLFATSSNSAFANTSIEIPFGLTPGYYYLRIRVFTGNQQGTNACALYTNGETVDVLLAVGNPPNCVSPGNLSSSFNSATSTELKWENRSGNTNSNYELEYGFGLFSLGSGTKVTLDSTRYFANNLGAFITYSFFVREICAPGDTSAWSARHSFNTYPYCVSNLYNTGCAGSVSYDIGFVGLGNIQNSTNNCLPGSFGNYTSLSTSLVPGSEYTMTLRTNSTTAPNFFAWIDFNRDGIFQDSEFLGQATVASNGIDRLLQFRVSGDAITGNTVMRVRSATTILNANNACSNTNLGEYEDYTVNLLPPPNCFQPFELEAQNFGISTLVSWSSFGAPDEFIYEYGYEGFTPSTGTTGTINSNNLLLQNLDVNQNYDFYVRAICGTDSSDINSFTFSNSNYCNTLLHSSTSINTRLRNVIIGSMSNLETGLSPAPNYYGDYTDSIIDVIPGTNVSFSIQTGGFSRRLAIWADYDKDGSFDNNLLWSNNFSQSSAFGSFTVPLGTPQGLVRLRVRSMNQTPNQTNACEASNTGETEDYTLNILPPSFCLNPINISASLITDSEANINWTPRVGSQFTEIRVFSSTNNFDSTYTFATNHVSGYSYRIKDLPASANCTVQVKNICQPGDTSAASSDYIFNTPCTGGCIYNLTLNRVGGTTWGGATVTVTMNGVNTDYGLTSGTSITYPIEVCGNGNISLAYNSGSANGQISFNLKNPFGTIIFNQGANPTSGIPLFQDNLECSTCADISNFNSEIVNENAIISWQNDGLQNGYIVEFSEQGFNPHIGIGTINNVIFENSILGNLPPLTPIDVYISPICENGDTLFDTSPDVVFNNPYCTGNLHNIGCGGGFNIGIGSVAINGQSFSESCSFNSYNVLNLNNIVTVSANSTLNLAATKRNSTYNVGWGAWIDYNRNGVFESSEFVGSSANGNNVFSQNISLPSGLAFGTYTMRVRAFFNTNVNSTQACTYSAYGETNDLLFKIEEPCPAPINVMVSNISDSGVTATWTGTGSEYQVLAVPANASPAGMMPINVNGNSYTFNNLNNFSNYKIYVRSFCTVGVTTTSAWVISNTFKTLCGIPTAAILATDSMYCFGEIANEISVATLPDLSIKWFEVGNESVVLSTSNAFTPNTAISKTYGVRYYDNFCEGEIDDIEIVVNSLPIVSLGADTSIFMESTITFSPIISNLNNGAYSWWPSDSLINPAVPNATSIPLSVSNQFSLTITDTITNCSATDSINVNILGGPITLNLFYNKNEVCDGANFNVTALAGGGLTGNYQYLWLGNPISSSGNAATYQAILNEVKTIEVSDGIDTATFNINIPINALPTISKSADTSICFGDDINLSVFSNTAVSYQWSDGENTANRNFEGLNSEVLYITVNDVKSCSSTDSIQISVLDLPALSVISDTNICSGSEITLNAISAFIPTWNDSLNSQSFTKTFSDSTTITVAVVDSNSCKSEAEIQVNALPIPVAAISADTAICFGDSISLSATGAEHILWNTAENSNSIVVHPNLDTTYTAVVSNSIGCADTAEVQITVRPEIGLSISNDTSFCNGGAAQLSASALTNVSYFWANGVTTNSVVLNSSGSVIFGLTVTDVFGCEEEATTLVTVHPNPVISLSDTIGVCDGENVQISASLSFEFASNFNNLSALKAIWSNGLIGNSISFAPSSDSWLYLEVVDTIRNCSAYDSVYVIINDLPNVSVGNDTSLCLGSPFTVTAEGAETYAFSSTGFTPQVSNTYSGVLNGNQFIVVEGTDSNLCVSRDTIQISTISLPSVSLQGPNAVCPNADNQFFAESPTAVSFQWSNGAIGDTISYNNNSAAILTVTATDLNSCSNTAFKNVGVLSVGGSVSAPQASCSDIASSFTASGGVSYLWEDGRTSSSIMLFSNSTRYFKVSITNANGCVKVDSVYHVSLALPEADAGSNDTICSGESGRLEANGSNVVYNWSNGVNNKVNMVSVNQTSSFTVTITSQNGCSILDSARIVVREDPSLMVFNDTVCEGNQAILRASGNGTFVWSNGATDSIASISAFNTLGLEVTLTDNFGCTNTDSVFAEVYQSQLNVSGAENLVCLFDTLVLTASGGNSYIWSNGDTSSSSAIFITQPTSLNITITDENACVFSDSVFIQTFDLPIISAFTNDTICPGGNANLQASGAVSYLWSTNQMGNSIIVNPTQTSLYTVIGTDSNNCKGSDSVVVWLNDVPPTGVAGPDITICLGDTAFTQSTPGFSYQWSTGQISQNAITIPLTSSNLLVTVTNAESCSIVDTVSIHVNPLPVITTSPDTSICRGDNAILQVQGGNFYQWSTGETTSQITVSPNFSNNYLVTASNNLGCSNSVSINITVLSNPQLVVSNDVALCQGNSTTLTATGGQTLVWSNGVFGTSNTVTPTSSQFYKVTAISSNGCLRSDSVYVTVNALPIVSFNNIPNACEDAGPIALNMVSPVGGSFSSSGNFISNGNFMPSISGSGTFNIDYQYTDVNGCSTSASNSVTVNPTPVITNIISNNPTACGLSNGSIQISSNSTNASFSINNGLGFFPVSNFGNLAAGSYGVVINALGCNSAVQQIALSAPNSPSAPSISGKLNYCDGETINAIQASGSGGQLNWYANQSLTQLLTTGNSFTPNATVGQTTYYVAELGGTCIGAAAAFTVSVQSLPPAPSISGGATYCDGDQIANLQSLPNLGGTILWYTQQGSTPIDSGVIFTPSNSMGTSDYFVRERFNSCFGAYASVQVTINPLPSNPIVIGDTAFCTNQGVSNLTVSNPSGLVEWFDAQNLLTPIASGNTFSPSSAVGLHQYAVKQSALNCHSAFVNISTRMRPSPQITNVSTTNPSACALSDGSISVTASGGTGALQFSFNGGTTFGPAATLSNIPNGGYPIVVSDNYCGSSIQLAVLTAPGAPSAPLVSGSANYCAGDSVADLIAIPDSGATIQWFLDPGFNTLFASTDTVSPISSTGNRTYYATQSLGNCQSISASAFVNILPLPQISTSGNTTICNGNSIQISAFGNGNFLWNTGSTGSSFTVSPTSNSVYYVSITDANFCVNNDSLIISVNQKPVVNLGNFAAVCSNASAFTLSQGSPVGGSFFGNAVSNGIFDPAMASIGTNSIFYTYTDVNGCSDTASSNIDVNPLPTINFSAINAVCEGDSPFLLNTANPQGGMYSGNGVNNNIFDPNFVGVGTFQISYTFTSSLGCSASSTQSITVNALPQVSLEPFTELCESGPSISLSGGLPAGGLYLLNGTQAITDFEPQVVGNFNIVYGYQDANGCVNSAQETITVNPSPSVHLGNDTIIADSGWTLFAGNFDAYQWSTGDTTPSILIASSGLYAVTVSNTFGCEANSSIQISYTVGFSDEVYAEVFKIFPNPTAGNFNLEISGYNSNVYTLTLSDLHGKQVYVDKIAFEGGTMIFNIENQNLRPGVYFLQVLGKEDYRTFRVIIQ